MYVRRLKRPKGSKASAIVSDSDLDHVDYSPARLLNVLNPQLFAFPV